jgi:hypothetical protein
LALSAARAQLEAAAVQNADLRQEIADNNQRLKSELEAVRAAGDRALDEMRAECASQVDTARREKAETELDLAIEKLKAESEAARALLEGEVQQLRLQVTQIPSFGIKLPNEGD